MTAMPEEFIQVLTPEIRLKLINVVLDAYKGNVEIYDPDGLGHDRLLFGLMVCKSIRKFISDLCSPLRLTETDKATERKSRD